MARCSISAPGPDLPQALPEAQLGELLQGAVAAQALLHRPTHHGLFHGPAAPLRRRLNGLTQARLREGRHEQALDPNQAFEGRIGLGGANDLSAVELRQMIEIGISPMSRSFYRRYLYSQAKGLNCHRHQ